MGSETPLKLPIIDFSNPDLTPGSPDWDSTKAKVKQAFEEYGCFEVLFDKIPLEIRKALFDSLEELFDLPLQTKQLNATEKPFHGYVGQLPEIPLYESLGVDGANILEKTQRFAQLLWPEGNPNFCKSVTFFSQQVAELDMTIRRMFLESLGLEKFYEEYKDSMSYLLRLMKYQGPQSTETKVGLKGHTDKNTMTILYQNQVEGLEVHTKEGEWISVKPTADSFVVLAGEAWTNGRVYPAKHRVMMRGNDARYSLGLFVVPKSGSIIKPLEELVDDEHPLLFKPFDYGKFLEFYSVPENLRADGFALKSYCGM